MNRKYSPNKFKCKESLLTAAETRISFPLKKVDLLVPNNWPWGPTLRGPTVQGPTVWGPTVCPKEVGSLVPGPNCPGTESRSFLVRSCLLITMIKSQRSQVTGSLLTDLVVECQSRAKPGVCAAQTRPPVPQLNVRSAKCISFLFPPPPPPLVSICQTRLY